MANTATAVPVPPAYEPPTIDEAEEEAAAAAEAANIGGPVSDYAGPAGETATEAEAPLAEAGEGEAEGQEQTEDELRDAAEGNEDDGLSPEEAQINEAIDDAANPLAGEQVEPSAGRRLRAAHVVRPSADSRSASWQSDRTCALAPYATHPDLPRSRAGSRVAPAAGAIGAGDGARTPKLTRALPASATIGASSR